MQIRFLVRAPRSNPLSISTGLPIHPPSPSIALSAVHPNAPLGAGLCIFNKFRESSRSRRSRPSVAVKSAFRLPRKRCPRVYLCARSSQSTSALLPSSLPFILPRPRHSLLPFAFRSPPCPADLAFSLSLYTYISFPLSPFLFHYIFFSPILRAANFSSVFLLFIFLSLSPLRSVSQSRAALSRALYLGAVSIRVWNTGNRTTRVY